MCNMGKYMPTAIKIWEKDGLFKINFQEEL
jgi:hypothetical protein